MEIRCPACDCAISVDNFGAMRLYSFAIRASWVYICDNCFAAIIKEHPISPGNGFPRKDNRTHADIERYLKEAQPYHKNPYGIKLSEDDNKNVYYLPPP